MKLSGVDLHTDAEDYRYNLGRDRRRDDISLARFFTCKWGEDRARGICMFDF